MGAFTLLVLHVLPLLSIASAGALRQPTEDDQAIPWQPAVTSKFQIVLDNKVLKLDDKTALVPATADIFDVDLHHTPMEVVQQLKAQGKKVICYFSAGGTEAWREDNYLFKKADIGDTMKEWKDERWLDIRSPDVWAVMANRIKMAADKGCDGIDPDNLGKPLLL
jgi:hypothetical protein